MSSSQQKRKCVVPHGCGKVLSKSAHYSHRTTNKCRKIDGETSQSTEDALYTGRDSNSGQSTAEENNQDTASQSSGGAHDNFKGLMNLLNRVYLLGILHIQMVGRLSDRTLALVLKFINLFLILLAELLHLDRLAQFTQDLPWTLYSARNFLRIQRNNYHMYAACPKCHKLYDVQSVISKTISKCDFVRWPRHPQRSKRSQCNTQLLKGNSTEPKRLYCCRPASLYLKEMVKRPNFLSSCNIWRKRSVREGYVLDIYDGRLWKEHSRYLQSETNLLLLLNCDWVQIWDHVSYSLGVVYAVILNLPRAERFLEKNILLLGVIPGPSEPRLHINTYLGPIVDDLLTLSKGIRLEDGTHYGNIYKCQLLGCSSDLPATRKLGGFISFHAKKGCSKCEKEFPRTLRGSKYKGNFGGFDMQNWTPRTGAVHKQRAARTRHAKTEAERKELESFGGRWSELFRLPYFCPIRGHTFDAMHGLWLGISKTMIKHYVKSGLIPKEKLHEIQATVNRTRVPSSIGRIPYKITSGFSSMTADQLKNWTLIFSPLALWQVLPDEDYRIWIIFVRASSIITRKLISGHDIDLVERLIVKFCTAVERRYGADFLTPNFHMVCHLPQVMRDYGNVHSFWCYAFERYNGTLGDYATNCHNITCQLMQRFLDQQHIAVTQLPEIASPGMIELFTDRAINRGTIQGVGWDIEEHVTLAFAQHISAELQFSVEIPDPKFHLEAGKTTTGFFKSYRMPFLSQVYKNIFLHHDDIIIHNHYTQLESVNYLGENFRPDRGDKVNCNIVRGQWLKTGYALEICLAESFARAGKIMEILVTNHSLKSTGQKGKLLLFKVDWFNMCNDPYMFGQSMHVYYKTCCVEGPYSFIPIQRILSKCAIQSKKHNGTAFNVIIPLPGKWSL